MITLILVEDHHIVRQGLRALLEKQADFSVLAEADNGLDALELVEQQRPDVLILDLMLPGLSGLEVTHQVVQRFPKTHVIILSMHADESYVLKALGNGARGYLLKETTAAELARAIRVVQSNGKYLSSPFSDHAVDSYLQKNRENSSGPHDELTVREREVLQLVVEGKTSRDIAKILVISTRTVDVHRANMMRKLHLHSQTELIRYAIKYKLLPSETGAAS